MGPKPFSPRRREVSCEFECNSVYTEWDPSRQLSVAKLKEGFE
jgi:hypothetical protein